MTNYLKLEYSHSFKIISLVIWHTLIIAFNWRCVKTTHPTPLTKDQFYEIYNIIDNPDEIYIDLNDELVIYVRNLPKNEVIDNRDCIKVPVKVNNYDSRHPINYICTTGRVNKKEALSDKKRFKKIE